MQHTYISLPLFCTSTMWNFQKLPSYMFNGGNVVRVLDHIFSLLLIFTLVATTVHCSISHFLTTATKFSCSSNKKCLLFGLSLALGFCPSFSRWASRACHLFSLFLCLMSFSIFHGDCNYCDEKLCDVSKMDCIAWDYNKLYLPTFSEI